MQNIIKHLYSEDIPANKKYVLLFLSSVLSCFVITYF